MLSSLSVKECRGIQWISGFFEFFEFSNCHWHQTHETSISKNTHERNSETLTSQVDFLPQFNLFVAVITGNVVLIRRLQWVVSVLVHVLPSLSKAFPTSPNENGPTNLRKPISGLEAVTMLVNSHADTFHGVTRNPFRVLPPSAIFNCRMVSMNISSHPISFASWFTMLLRRFSLVIAVLVPLLFTNVYVAFSYEVLNYQSRSWPEGPTIACVPILGPSHTTTTPQSVPDTPNPAWACSIKGTMPLTIMWCWMCLHTCIYIWHWDATGSCTEAQLLWF
jgi:hypothetical protein